MEISLQQVTSQVEELSKSIGHWMKEQTSVSEHMAEVKSENNLVTFVDKESERRFVEGLRQILPEAGFVAEEGTGEPSASGLNWVIDPLDGTTNFVHGMPVWCTSIGLCQGNEAISGVIYDPSSNECFTAWKGGGAFLNGKPIRVSNIPTLEQSLFATGFPYDDFGKEEAYIALFRDMMRSTRGLRRLGSAALDMAWTACGRVEGFYEYGLNPWDVAAGCILVQEAGGMVADFSGGDNYIFGEDLVCTNALVHKEMLKKISHYFN
ncbi:MAG: inositol monophosphatase family protein [Flavobacteriales bacterium]|jgi:myo-inositol-1(or 4)-monophosphatase